MGPHRRSVVEEGPQIPFAIPARVFDRTGEAVRPLPPERSPFRIPFVGQYGSRTQDGQKEPSQPYAFPPAFRAHAVQSIIPIAAADEGKFVRPQPPSVFDRPNA